MQIVVVAGEIDEHLVADDLGLPTQVFKGLLRADVTLFQIGQIGINDDLNLTIHPVFQQTLNFGEILFGQHHHRLPDVARFSVPVGSKVPTLVLRPLVVFLMILHPVLAKFLL